MFGQRNALSGVPPLAFLAGAAEQLGTTALQCRTIVLNRSVAEQSSAFGQRNALSGVPPLAFLAGAAEQLGTTALQCRTIVLNRSQEEQPPRPIQSAGLHHLRPRLVRRAVGDNCSTMKENRRARKSGPPCHRRPSLNDLYPLRADRVGQESVLPLLEHDRFSMRTLRRATNVSIQLIGVS